MINQLRGYPKVKIDKRLKKVVEKYALESLTIKGDIDTKKAQGFVKNLKSFTAPQAIAALSLYVKRLKTEVEKSTLEIKSAVALSPAQVSQVTKAIKIKHNVNSVETGVEGFLLGGIRVKIGDLVYDDTLGQKIAALKEAII